MIGLKRVYDPFAASDGYRILVDRLWPRGISKEKAHIDYWCRDVAPTNELRHWFGHDPARWDEFVLRYTKELEKNASAVEMLRTMLIKHKRATLLFAAKDTGHNNAVALLPILQRAMRK